MDTFKPLPITRTARRPSHGQGLVEFALLLPLLILVVIGTVDLGRLFDAYVVMTNAAREGARYGASNPTQTSNIQAQSITEANNSGYTITSSMVTVSTPSGTTGGNPVTVSIRYPFTFMTTYLFAGVQTLQVQTSATMVILQ